MVNKAKSPSQEAKKADSEVKRGTVKPDETEPEAGRRIKSAGKKKAKPSSKDASGTKMKELRAAIVQCQAEHPDKITEAESSFKKVLFEASRETMGSESRAGSRCQVYSVKM